MLFSSCGWTACEVAGLPALSKHVFSPSGLTIGYPVEEGEVKPRLPLEATLHMNTYSSDDELGRLIESYDEIQSAWCAAHDLHPKDPRWSAVMGKRLPAVERRAEVGECLRHQGFLVG